MKQAPAELRFAAMAVDAVVFSMIDSELVVLVAPVASDSPYQGKESFPGGLIRPHENASEAVVRVLAEKTSLTTEYHEQLYTFSEVNRDKRNRVISVAYIAFVRPGVAATYTSERGRFVAVKKLGQLAYDHNQILDTALNRLRSKISYTTMAQFLLPKHFTLSELQHAYELILGRELDKRNFRKKILAIDIVKDTGSVQSGVSNRPAALYKFTKSTVTELPLLAV